MTFVKICCQKMWDALMTGEDHHLLRLSSGKVWHYELGDIEFCPWCGTKVEIKESKS